MAAAEGLRIVLTTGQHAIEVAEPIVGRGAAGVLRREGEILAIVDDRGGQIEFGILRKPTKGPRQASTTARWASSG